MDQTTQQNSALVEQSAAAAQSMTEQARNLVITMGRFKLQSIANREISNSSSALRSIAA
jgi:restriction endonuclease Mrr